MALYYKKVIFFSILRVVHSIRQNIIDMFSEIDREAKNCNRNTGEIELCAVSKTKPIEYIQEALMDKRIRNIGENYAQEIVSKFKSGEKRDFKLRMIGHLQSNKVKLILPYIDTIDSVDSLKLLDKINKEALAIGKCIEILVELNTAGDGEKTGFLTEDEALFALDGIEEKKGLVLKGFMTMGALGAEESECQRSFEKLRLFKERVEREHKGLSLPVLSMGMSSDWKAAIKEGSTMIRIGTSIFGKRGTSL